VRRGEHDQLRGLGEQLARHRGDAEGHELERGVGIGRVSHDPLSRIGVEEEVDARDRRF